MSEPRDDLPGLEDEGGVLVNLANTVDPLLSQWSRFRDKFILAMEASFWTIEDLEQKIAHRRAFFFPGADSAMVAEITVYPGGAKMFQVLWVCGEIEELLRMLPGVEAVGRMMGCTGMLVEGRAAWAKLLKPMNYTPWSVTLHKGL